jgi:hypothetical protein
VGFPNHYRLVFAVVIDDAVAAVGELGVKIGQGVPSRFIKKQ